jgi:hypothetical protein
MLNQLAYDFYGEKLPFWLGWIIFTLIIGIIFVIRGKKTSSEIKSQKAVYYDAAIFFFGYVATRISFLFSDVERLNNGTSQWYQSLVLIAYIFSTFAMSILIYSIEHYLLPKTKKIFSIISFSGTGILIILLVLTLLEMDVIAIARTLTLVTSTTAALVIGVLYLYLITKTSGTLKRNSLFSFFGILTLMIGIALDMDALVQMKIIPIQLAPIVTAIGILFFALGQKNV